MYSYYCIIISSFLFSAPDTKRTNAVCAAQRVRCDRSVSASVLRLLRRHLASLAPPGD